jgi:hypothetical protein
VRPPNEPDRGPAAGEGAQAPEDVVPRRIRDLNAAHGHIGHGPDAHHEVRPLQGGVDLVAQADGGAGGPAAGAARPEMDEALVGRKAARTRSWC